MALLQDKITEQHILDEIVEIDRNGVRKGDYFRAKSRRICFRS